jgi:hypothetical protein
MKSSSAPPSLSPYVSHCVLSTVLCILFLVGCSVLRDNGTPPSGSVRAELVDETIAVHNRGRDTVWTFEAGRQILARMDWRPSLTRDGLAPGSTRTVALDTIPMDDDEERVVIFWWPARTTAGEREPGDVSRIDVEI